jgi:hypothetical protein
MSQPSTVLHPPPPYVHDVTGYRGMPTAFGPSSVAAPASDISAALLTLQLQRADVAAIANANRLLAARFLANALNDERNARVLHHRLEVATVSW